MEESEKLRTDFDTLLIDGSGFAYRAGNVMHLTNDKGENMSVIFGVLSMLRSFISNHSFSEICVVWDGKRYKEEKRKSYPEYKKNRETPPGFSIDIHKQIIELIKILPFLGIKQIQKDGMEADDVIGLLCEGLEQERVLVISSDKDLLQLVLNGATVYYTHRDIYLDKDNFEQEFGLKPEHFIFYKTIVGDGGDGITGLRGFGDKTAKKLLASYGPWTDWFTNIELFEKILPSLTKPQRSLMLEKEEDGVHKALKTLVKNYAIMSIGFLNKDHKDELLLDFLQQKPLLDEKALMAYFLNNQFNNYLSRFDNWLHPFRLLERRRLKDEAYLQRGL